MTYQYLLKSLLFVWASSRKWTILLLINQFLQALLPLVALYLTKLIVDAVTELGTSKDFSEVIQYVLFFGGIQLIQAILQNYQQLISETQSQLVTDYMSAIIIDKAVSIDLSYYENAQYHNTFHQAQRQAVHRPVQILNNLTDLLRNGFLLASLAGLLLFLHWGIALVLLFFALPIAGVKWYYSKKLFEWEKNRTELEREAWYLNHVLTTDIYAKEVRIFNLGNRLRDQFIKVRKALFSEKFRIGKQRVKAGLLARSAEIIAMTATYGFIAWRTFQGNITVGDLVMYFHAFQKGQVAIQSVLTSLVGLYNNRLFLSHLFELLELKSKVKEPAQPKSIPEKMKTGIRLENINFAYPGTEKLVLNNINLTFKKGEVIAFVGENGSGKTTLVKLLCRLYDPKQGEIYFDNENIKHFSLSHLRQKISVIYQDFAQYHFSASENIRIGDLEKQNFKNQLEIAAQKSGAFDFIQQMPKQFKQQLGRRFKKGMELSGGQWQKIALSRAFFKEAKLIILDEPSSSIDPLAEAAIFKHFREMAKDKILILVTHRLYNLKMADKIVVLKEGKMVEQGNHQELVMKKGLYLEMFEKQTA